MEKIIYSFVVPIYNDGYLVSAFCEEFLKVFKQYLNKPSIEQEVELIFINDGSTDNSLELLKESVDSYTFVKVINLSRNFGQHIAILCGYKNSTGDIVGRLNVDMQDPPYEIPKLLEYLDSDSDTDMVVGLQNKRKGKALDKITGFLFFKFFNYFTGSKVPQYTSSLRVMNRTFVNAIISTNDKTPFLQGLENWVGFNTSYVKINHHKRSDNQSSYNLKKRIKLAIDAAISFSDRPLKLACSFGFFSCLLSLILFVCLTITKFVNPEIEPGFTATACLILFIFGIQIFVTGLCGIYIGKILLQTQNRPVFIIREMINFPK
jgi:glycosyltransferase involved in cell wall biosynthesis